MMPSYSVRAGQTGTLVKIPAVQVIEILAQTGIDFAVLDAEHAPFDRRDIDMMMLASRATGLPLIVRVPGHDPATVLSCLDLGAAGLVIPHVNDAATARAVVAASRYRDGIRGYSGGPRHAGYGTSRMAEIIECADTVPVIVQIEHPDAVARLDEICATGGIAGILVGRADLALAMGYSDPNAPEVLAVVERIFAKTAGLDLVGGVVVGSAAERQNMANMGANWFVISNDQALLREAMIARLGPRSY